MMTLQHSFCINDMGALGCVQAAQAGKDDILIYGVDGNPDFMDMLLTVHIAFGSLSSHL